MSKNVKRIPSAYKIPKYFLLQNLCEMLLMLQEVLPDLPVKGKFFGKHLPFAFSIEVAFLCSFLFIFSSQEIVAFKKLFLANHLLVLAKLAQ